jgi:hypothetical protein
VISGAQLRETTSGSVLDALSVLRPNLISRATLSGGTAGEAIVYLDGKRLGGLAALAGIPTSWVATVRVMRPSTPDLQYSAGSNALVIVVTTQGAPGTIPWGRQ